VGLTEPWLIEPAPYNRGVSIRPTVARLRKYFPSYKFLTDRIDEATYRAFLGEEA
jgi:hypothetical protein